MQLVCTDYLVKDYRLFRNVFFLSAIISAIIVVCSLGKKPQSSRIQEVGQYSHAHGVILGVVPCGTRVWPYNPCESLLWLYEYHSLWMTIQDLNDTDRSKCVAWSRELLFPRHVEAIAMRYFTVAGICACLGQLAVQWNWLPALYPGPCIWTGCLKKLWMLHQEMLKAS